MNKLLFICFMCIFSCVGPEHKGVLNAQAPAIEGTKGYGTPYDNVAREDLHTTDGGYIIIVDGTSWDSEVPEILDK